jgi:hypothetical protein
MKAPQQQQPKLNLPAKTYIFPSLCAYDRADMIYDIARDIIENKVNAFVLRFPDLSESTYVEFHIERGYNTYCTTFHFLNTLDKYSIEELKKTRYCYASEKDLIKK